MFELTDRVVIVTGGGGGIGGATANALHGQGATVIVADVAVERAEKVVAGLGCRAQAVQLDATNPDSWADLLHKTGAEFGRLDGLVNAAGVLRPRPFADSTLRELDETLDLNVRSVFMGCKAAAPLMIATREAFDARPSIVNLSSIYGMYAGVAHVVYSASKGAVRMISKGLAQELARHQIRVNTVFPGPVNTWLMTNSVELLGDFGLRPKGPDGLAAVAKMHPMGRVAEPEDVASVITFLCADASSFMTGGELVVDGGLTLT
jgi:NAD(P)-dependent dehydrogenase (short-subunit alcohol dehydrogenase family)